MSNRLLLLLTPRNAEPQETAHLLAVVRPARGRVLQESHWLQRAVLHQARQLPLDVPVANPTFKKWASQLSPSPPCIPPTPQKSLQPRGTRAAANPKSHPSSAHRAAFKGLSLALPGRIEPAPCRHLLKLNCCTALDGIRRGDPNEKLRHQLTSHMTT